MLRHNSVKPYTCSTANIVVRLINFANSQIDVMLVMWLCRYGDGTREAVIWASLAVYKCSQPLHYQLHQLPIHHRIHRSQPIPLHLLARPIWHSLYSSEHSGGCIVDVGGRCGARPAQPRWVVVAQFRHQDSEVSMGSHHSLPLHHLLRPSWHAHAFRYHRPLLLAHLRSYSTCQTAPTQNTAAGKLRLAKSTLSWNRCFIIRILKRFSRSWNEVSS